MTLFRLPIKHVVWVCSLSVVVLSLVFLGGVGIPRLAGAESPDSIVGGVPAGGGISGMVSADGGGPLEGICVYVQEASFFDHDPTTTDDGGAYEVRGLPPGEYLVRFQDCRDSTLYISEWYNDQPDRSSPPRGHGGIL